MRSDRYSKLIRNRSRPLAPYGCWPGGLTLRVTGFAGVIPVAGFALKRSQIRLGRGPFLIEFAVNLDFYILRV